MSLIVLWPTQFRHCYENPKRVTTPRDETPFPSETPRLPAREVPALGEGGPSSRRHLGSPRSVSFCSQLGAGLAASGWPPPGRCKYLFPPRGPRRGHLPASLPLARRGRFPAREQQPRAAAAGSGALVDAVPWRASPPSASRPGCSQLWGAPLRACAVPRGRRGSDSCQRRRRWRRPSVFAEEKHETDPLALPLPFPGPEPLSWLAGN